MTGRFLTALLILILAITLQFSLRGFLGFYSNLTLAALVALSIVVSLPELIFLVLVAVLVLNWQPAFSPDMLALGLLPIVCFYVARLIKWKQWIISSTAIIASFIAMYLILAPNLLFSSPLLVVEDVFAGLAFGLVVALVFNKCENNY